MFTLPDVFFGREAECRRLLETIQACKSGSGGLVIVAGEAGVGKSALLQEVTRRARRARLAITRSAYTTETITDPYRPVLEALTTLAPEKAQRIQQWRRDTLKQLTEQSFTEVEQQHFVLQESRESWEGQLVEAYILSARRRPVVVQIEDLHLATETAWVFLSRLLQAAIEEPLVVLSTLRLPHRGIQGPPLYADPILQLSRHGLVTRVLLEPFSPYELTGLVHRYLPRSEFSPVLHEYLFSVSGGVPGAARKTLVRLVRQGAMYESEGRWVDDSASLRKIPRSRCSRVARRPASLAHEVEEILGEEVGHEIRDEVISRLEATRQELVSGRDGSREDGGGLPNDEAMSPGHQASVASTISEDRGKRLHLRVAQTLESIATDAGTLGLAAQHYALSDEPGRAIPCLAQLADDSLRGFGFPEARLYYRREQEILLRSGRAGSPEHLRVGIRLSWLERLLGDARQALSVAQDLLVAETASAQEVEESSILLQQALALRRLDDNEAALAQLRGCLQVAAHLTAFSRALIHLEIGVAEFARGRHREGKKDLLRSLELAKTAHSEALLVRVLRDLGAVEMALSEPLKAIGYFGQCVASLKRLGDKRRLANVYFFLGINQTEVDDWAAANRSLGRALALSDHLGLHSLKADAYFQRALVLMELGRFPEAREHARKAGEVLSKQWEPPPAWNPIERYLQESAAQRPSSGWQSDNAEPHQHDTPDAAVRVVEPSFVLKLDAYRRQLRRRVLA